MFGGVSEGGRGAVKDSVSFYSRSDVISVYGILSRISADYANKSVANYIYIYSC